MSWSLRFLGVGGAQATELGSSSVVLERDGEPRLMIDCGTEALSAFVERYRRLPPALFITHTHFDHIAGLERLFFKVWFDAALRGTILLYVPAGLVPWLQARVADYPGVLAEGGVNFWDAFRLIPHHRGFWHDGLWFDTFSTRHHQPGTSFGVALAGSFIYTGDTRPIPEQLQALQRGGEIICHDCGLQANPSHTGVDDLGREYDETLRRALLLYHYGSVAEGQVLRQMGYRVAEVGRAYPLEPATAVADPAP